MKIAEKVNVERHFRVINFVTETENLRFLLPSVIMLGFLLLLLQPVFAGDKVLPMPKQVKIYDSREKFYTPRYKSTKHGDFCLSIGECIGGDPGFGSFSKGDEFTLDLYIYHFEPKHPMGNVSERVILGMGKYGKSITPAVTKPLKVKYKGLTFTVKLLKTSADYGAGKNVVQVDIVE